MKNIELFNPEYTERIVNSSDLLRRHARIFVYFVDSDETSITIKAIQKENPNGNYLNSKELAARIKETFGKYTDKKIHARPTPYNPSPTEVVTPKYVLDLMREHKVSKKSLPHALGVSLTEMSEVIQGDRPMGRWTKAALYYFFKTKE